MIKQGTKNTLSASAKPNTPSDDFLERAALYCFMLDNSLMKATTLTIEDFYSQNNKKIFLAMGQLAEDGSGIDMVTLSAKLTEMQELENIGGLSYLKIISDAEPTVMFINDYETKLKEFRIKRQILTIGNRLLFISQNGENLSSQLTEIHQEIREMNMLLAGNSKTIASQVEDWILVTPGKFEVTAIYRDLGLVTPGNRKAVLMALNRFEQKGMISKCGEKRGCYKSVPIDMEKMDLNFREEDEEEFPLIWPTAIPIHNFVRLFPKNLIVIAGEPNSGKTSLLLNLIRYNLSNVRISNIDYFCSEGGDQELRMRLKAFEADGVPMSFWQTNKLRAWERSQDFAEVINPNGINLIDFLELHEDFYLVGKLLAHIWRRLDKGIAIVALQKDPNKSVGKGGSSILEKPRLVLNMMLGGKAKIIKGKSWRNQLINPDNKTFSYKIINGCKFVSSQSGIENNTKYDS